ncbi:MAG: RNA-binding S4 domain-containing protein [Thiobacillus sp.]|nr:RNA-binding S4 domain-containing protein [Thiobacillus sp.]
MRVSQDQNAASGVRVDKWLWAARFFKTRALAQQAVEGGKVRLNGERCKCSRELRPGDRLEIRIDVQEWVVTVRGLTLQRGPAPVARQLYEEDVQSREKRERAMEERKRLAEPGGQIRGRPTKRDRRLLHRFNESL